MKSDVSFVRERFRRFNVEVFSGVLPDVPIKISHAKTYLGRVVYKRQRHLFRKDTLYGFTLCVSDRYDLEEHVYEDIILHEMIHLYILSQGLHDTSSHGKIFRQMMHDINKKWGRAITISYKCSQISGNLQILNNNLVHPIEKCGNFVKN